MPNSEPGKIRNVAVIGHRGTGKTSLVESLLYESGTINRLGSVAEHNTVSDYDDEEKRRGISTSAAVTHLEWEGRTINLIDTPGEPSFQADVLSALRVVEGAIVTVSGVMGVEVGTERLWRRCEELGLSRLILVNLLDRERADFYGTLEGLRDRLSDRCVAVEIPIGTEHEFRGVVDLVHMVAYLHGEDASGHDESVPIPDDMTALAEEYHDKLMDVVAETSDELMERYLEGGEISREEMAVALKQLVTDGLVFPVGCGAATRNIGAHGLLDLIVEGLPSPARARNVPESAGAGTLAYVFKTIADPYSGKINLLRVYSGTLTGDHALVNSRTHTKERLAGLLVLQGKDHTAVTELGPGMIGAVAKLKDTATGDVLADVDEPAPVEPLKLPEPVVSFAIEPKAKGDEDKVHASLRRLAEEDPSLDVHRDAQTGETIVSGLSQMHVEIVLERMARRFGVEVNLKPPRVPYRETIRRKARAQGRYKKQTGGRGQFGDCHVEIEPLDAHDGLRVRGQDRRRRYPAGLPAGCRQGDPGGDVPRRAGGRAGGRRQGDAGRRLLPHGRLVRDGVQDRRLDGVQAGGGSGRPRAPGADHAARGDGAGGERRRRDRRHDVAPGPRAGDGPRPRGDGGAHRSPDGRGAHLRARPDVDDRRPRRLHDVVLAVRRGPGPCRTVDHQRRPEGARAGQGVAIGRCGAS